MDAFVSTENTSSDVLSCNTIMAAGSAAGFSVDQLKKLTVDEDVRDCLYELGAQQLSQEQATLLWNRVTEVGAYK